MLPAERSRRAAHTVAGLVTQLDDEDSALIGVDLDLLDAQLAALRASFPSSVRHSIAIKTMPHPRMLGYLVGQGFGLEAASIEEVHMALAAGAAPADVIFDSPVKTRSEIAWCDEHLPGGLLNANSLAELERYPQNPSFQVGLRINPEVDTGAPSVFDVSDHRSKFGTGLSTDVGELVDACIASGVTALHIHIGSQVPGADAHVEAIGRLLDLAETIDTARAERGDERRITALDIGGGLRSEPEGHDVMAAYGRRLRDEHSRLFEFDVRTEFGQWVHTAAGWAASRVESVEERAVPMAFIHLGADFFMREVYGSTSSSSYEFAVVKHDGQVAADDPVTYDLVGPLCFAGDVLARDLELPRLDEGDWVVVSETGANTLGLWSRHCSRTVPKVVAVRNGECEVWSKRRANP